MNTQTINELYYGIIFFNIETLPFLFEIIRKREKCPGHFLWSQNYALVFLYRKNNAKHYAFGRVQRKILKTFLETLKLDILKMSKNGIPNTLQNTFFLKWMKIFVKF